MIRPVLMKMRWPPATKALSELSWTIMISTALGSRPAAFQIGVTKVRMVFSISASRIRLRRWPPCAWATRNGASASSARQKRVKMRLVTVGTGCRQARNAQPPRQLRSLALIAVFLLAGCGGSETGKDQVNNTANPSGLIARKAGISSLVTGSVFAAVAADESRAAEIGRDVLRGGGNAIDAAVAMYFAMAVTLPSAAGLGAAGACIVHDSKTKAGEVFAFPPIAAPGPINGVSFLVPTGVRAVTLMHIRHGQTRWEFDVAGAERLARSGVPVSTALSRDLQAGATLLGADRETRRIFGKGTGVAVTAG